LQPAFATAVPIAVAFSSPAPPQYEPDQMAAVNTNDILQQQQPATLGTWIVGVVLVIAAVAWITLVVWRLRG
jgi:hypothetical protein